MKKITTDRKLRRKRRVSSNIRGTADMPRVVVFRSNRYIYAQAIDDVVRKTLASSSGKGLSGKKSEQAKAVGMKLAEKMKGLKISKAVYDRSSYTYLGRVKALCEGLREGGIKI
ncbi:MAG: 50S ribosomal protein L18 [Patescibacteria group bacterium]